MNDDYEIPIWSSQSLVGEPMLCVCNEDPNANIDKRPMAGYPVSKGGILPAGQDFFCPNIGRFVETMPALADRYLRRAPTVRVFFHSNL